MIFPSRATSMTLLVLKLSDLNNVWGCIQGTFLRAIFSFDSVSADEVVILPIFADDSPFIPGTRSFN
ncbi:hypothetical protein OPV22_026587 [Ensete ventricosum]|uniref:Uncharacterized protein n=1 Tax=Ensete ventricosum TaxID=4639 RepID=A0AAV8Q6X7_ENSVE|nr:hypothetical protein OPV22_026587 [Ensete ventricosum]